MRTCLIAMMLAVAFLTLAAQQQTNRPHLSPTAQPLVLWTEKQLAVPGFSSWGPAQCDSDLNLYFRIGETYNETQILEMSKDGERHNTYTLPSEFAATTAYVTFRVSPDGTVHVLAESKEGIQVFSFEAEHSDPSRTLLSLASGPSGVRPLNFVVANDGNILLSGRFGDEAPPKLAKTGYLALFSPSGKLIKEIRGDKSILEPSGHVRLDSASTIDERGNFYMAESQKIMVVSESGKLLRDFVPDAPEPDYRIGQLQICNGRLAVWFAKTLPNRKIDTKLGIYDSADGRFLGMYEPDEQLGNNPVCFDGSSFLFFRIRNGFVNLAIANLR